ncbi:MAG TPA: hypothetical protein VFQ25_08015 [Ktedonobacterales bacterium]|nr:hypothetical protein [Ktedonobacterales bacterium]
MMSDVEEARLHANDTRYRPGERAGHYESFFVRANHPTRPLAFWIRYTIFSPQRHPEQAIGELWAIVFDGESGRHVAVKHEAPLSDCVFDPSRFSIRVGDASLEPGRLSGAAESHGRAVRWDLTYSGGADPLFLLPLSAYAGGGSQAKSLVGLPLAVFSGRIVVNGEPLEITDWVGSQNHNWGARHTDHYAWGQVAGFDDAPEVFLEIVTARRRLGPLWTPFVTLLVVRRDGEEISLNTPRQMLRASGAFEPFTWRFRSEMSQARVEGRIEASSAAFVGLTYHNPPGGAKICLNTKLASCQLTITRRQGSAWRKPERLTAQSRAAFEILTDHPDPRVPLSL